MSDLYRSNGGGGRDPGADLGRPRGTGGRAGATDRRPPGRRPPRPENSLPAFRHALAVGVDDLETDVHLTADGEVVVLHHPTLDRITTGSGPVAGVRLADLGSVRLKARDTTVTEEPVPTLAQLLDLLRPGPAELLLEIKVGADRQQYPSIEEKVLALVRARELLGRTVIMAFESETVRRVRALEPAVRTLLLIGRGRAQRDRVWPAEAVERAREAGATDVGMNHRLIDPDVVRAVRKAGLGLAAWTVNEEADLSLGVDVLISDRPDLVRRLRGRGAR